MKNHQQPELFAITGWAIWNQRNQVRMHQPSCSPHLLAASAKERLAEFISTKPALGILMDQASGIGVVLSDENGLVLASLAQQLPHLYTPLITEAKAASRALKFAAELGFNRVILEGDYQVLVKALKEDRMFLCTNGLFIEDVLFYASFFY